MARAMADPAFRQTQLAGLDADHVAPLNRLVDALREQYPGRRVAAVAPGCAGVGTRVLALLPAPPPPPAPPAPEDGSGAGEPSPLSLDGDDDASARLLELVQAAGIDPSLVLPWPAVPFPVDPAAPLSMTDTKSGRAALDALVPLLPRLRSVVLHGKDAGAVWSAYAAGTRELPSGIRVEPVTFATDEQALAQHRASRLRRLAATYASVADALR